MNACMHAASHAVRKLNAAEVMPRMQGPRITDPCGTPGAQAALFATSATITFNKYPSNKAITYNLMRA